MTKEQARALKAGQEVLVKVNDKWVLGFRNFNSKCKPNSLPMIVKYDAAGSVNSLKTIDVGYANIRSLSEKPFIEEEERAVVEREKTFSRQYFLEWLRKAKIEYEAVIVTFQADIAKDPEYAIRWSSANVIIAKWNYVHCEMILRGIEKNLEKLWPVLEEVRNDAIRIQLQWSSSNSTCKWTNAVEEANALARTRWIQGSDFYLRSLKKFDI